MTAAVVTLALAIAGLAALGIVLGLVVRSQAKDVAAANAKALANGEAQLEQAKQLDELVAREKATAAKLTFEQARADEAEAALEPTQRELNAATEQLARARVAAVLGMSLEQAFAEVQAELREPLSKQPGTALEEP